MNNNEQKKKKRFYKKGQTIWSLDLKKEVEVKSVDTKKIEITVIDKSNDQEHTFPLWSVDVLKYKAKEELESKKSYSNHTDNLVKFLSDMQDTLNNLLYPEVYFAKVRETAIIPTKRKEDAGYDIYSNLENFKQETDEGTIYEIECPLLKTTLIPTGLAVAMPDTHYLDIRHERGSTAVQSMGVLAGVVDSGFRNEIFVALTPMYKAVIITSEVDKVEENDTHILYPLSKAICQGTIDIVPEAKIIEKTYDELKKIKSDRGMTMLGQSGK